MSEMINSPYVLLLVGLAILVFGGEILVRYASGLAIKAKVTPLIVGLTVVAIGTSSPELFASIQAILSGSSGIAVGNVVGSNIANLGLALGLTAIVRPLSIDKGILKMDWPILMVVTVLFGALAIDGVYSRLDGVVFLASMATFMFVQISRSRRIKKRNELAENRTLNVKDNGSDSNSRFEDISEKRYVELIFGIATGSLLLYYGAAWFISCATDIAKNFNISEHVIGITVVAFGTSVPEIVASVTAALKGQSDLSIGNFKILCCSLSFFSLGSIPFFPQVHCPNMAFPSSANLEVPQPLSFAAWAIAKEAGIISIRNFSSVISSLVIW